MQIVSVYEPKQLREAKEHQENTHVSRESKGNVFSLSKAVLSPSIALSCYKTLGSSTKSLSL